MEFYSEQSLKLIEMASSSHSNVLITGATGTGKTCLAKKIHDSSSRRTGPFVVVNLATIHEGTIESELFGHEKGAFTGAEQKRQGRIEAAHGGTLFLDEVGELTLKFQARLLEFLQSKKLTPVGSNREISLDIRIVAATNRDLRESVRSREFREDLFHRLNVIPIELKPVQSRMKELDELFHHFLEMASTANGKVILRLQKEVVERFESYSWPGNFREVKNVIDFAVISCKSTEIRLQDLPPWFLDETARELKNIDLRCQEMSKVGSCSAADSLFSLSYCDAIAGFEKTYFRQALIRNRGRIAYTARQLGMNKTTLLRRIYRHGLQGDANCLNGVGIVNFALGRGDVVRK